MPVGAICMADVGPLLLTAKELARLLGVAPCTVWTWHAAGRIPLPVKIGGVTRWRRSEIEQWIEAGAPGREKWQAMRC